MDQQDGPSSEMQAADGCRNVSDPCNFSVSVTTAQENQQRLFDIQSAIKDAFQDADFNEPFGPESPWAHTREGLTGPDADRYLHVIAEDDQQKILAAVFRVPAQRQDGEDAADPGWFFVAPDLHLRMRAEVVREVLQTAHWLMRKAGFPRVVTEMGTHTGGRLLKRHFGYVHDPVVGQENRWIRDL